MELEKITNFGKGLTELASDKNFIKIRKQMVMPIGRLLLREIGLIGLIKMTLKARHEIKIMARYNWSATDHSSSNISQFSFVFEDIANMKALVDMLGEDKACTLMADVLDNVDSRLASSKIADNLLMIPVEELKTCDDPFIGFKEFIKASELALDKECFHKLDITEDTNDYFAFRVNYCAAHKVAEEMGNPLYCFPWCQLDEVVLPKAAAALGFHYSRPSALGSGQPNCEFIFERAV